MFCFVLCFAHWICSSLLFFFSSVRCLATLTFVSVGFFFLCMFVRRLTAMPFNCSNEPELYPVALLRTAGGPRLERGPTLGGWVGGPAHRLAVLGLRQRQLCAAASVQAVWRGALPALPARVRPHTRRPKEPRHRLRCGHHHFRRGGVRGGCSTSRGQHLRPNGGPPPPNALQARRIYLYHPSRVLIRTCYPDIRFPLLGH